MSQRIQQQEMVLTLCQTTTPKPGDKMTDLVIPEDLKEILEELVAYDGIDGTTEEELEWAQEWLYAYEPIKEEEEKVWKIEIEM